jgi:hypothetical protein
MGAALQGNKEHQRTVDNQGSKYIHVDRLRLFHFVLTLVQGHPRAIA